MEEQEKIVEFYNVLFNEYGYQNWWPAETKLECVLGAILTQNTSWKNAEKAIENLKFKSKITIDKLTKLNLNELSLLIKPSGFYNQKAKTIKNFIEFINNYYSGQIDNMLSEETTTLRNKLLKIKGIGKETADCILLYALNNPVFVVDNYTKRILYRHGIITKDSTYDEIQKLFMENLNNNPKKFNEYHALIVKVGKFHCNREPNCESCPLAYDLN